MKKRILTLFFVATLFLISGCSNLFVNNTSPNSDEPRIITQTVGDFIVRQLHGQNKKTLSSARFKTQFTIPSTWNIEEGQTSSNGLATYVLRRKNTNTDERSQRDTPNGFNTGIQDLAGLDMYGRGENVHFNTLQLFQRWHDATVSNRQVVKTVQRTMSNNQIYFTQEADGIDSVGQYYYLATPLYIFVFGSDDIPDADMTAIFQSLTMHE